jgi:hypothetical protein
MAMAALPLRPTTRTDKRRWAKTIGIDIIFSERDRTSPQLLKKTLEDDFGYTLDTSDIPSEILDHDTFLASILSKGSYVLGYSFLFDNTTTSQQKCTFHPVSLIRRGNGESIASVMGFHQAKGVICYYKVLANAVPDAGFLNGTPDIDGVLRRLPLIIEYDGNFHPSFPLAVLMQFRHHDALVVQSDSARISHFSLADVHIPTDYARRPGRPGDLPGNYPTVSQSKGYHFQRVFRIETG